MRRLLSCAVQIRPAPITSIVSIPVDQRIRILMPTDSEVRDAIARCTRDLEQMRQTRGTSWTALDGTFAVSFTPEGEVVLRGQLIIERLD